MLIRNELGNIFNRVNNPAAVFDKETGTLYKIGEYEIMKQYYQTAIEAYDGAGFKEVSQDLCLMELPREQETIDKVFQNTGYVKVLYESLNKE